MSDPACDFISNPAVKDPYTSGTAASEVLFTSEVKFTKTQKDAAVVEDDFGLIVMTANMKKGWSTPWRAVMRAALRLIKISPNARAELRAALDAHADDVPTQTP